MGWFRRAERKISADSLFRKWFHIQVPEGHASLEAFEAAMTAEEHERLPTTLEKLAMDGVERIYQVRQVELQPDATGLAYLDELLDAELRWKLTQDQDPRHPRNLFRLVATEFGCIVGEILVREANAKWLPQRAPNLWRSRVKLVDGEAFDPFYAVVRQMSDERQPGALAGLLAGGPRA